MTRAKVRDLVTFAHMAEAIRFLGLPQVAKHLDLSNLLSYFKAAVNADLTDKLRELIAMQEETTGVAIKNGDTDVAQHFAP